MRGKVCLNAGLCSAFYDVLVASYVLRFVETVGLTLIAPMLVSVTDFGLTFRRIGKQSLAGFAVGAGYDKVPLEGCAFG